MIIKEVKKYFLIIHIFIFSCIVGMLVTNANANDKNKENSGGNGEYFTLGLVGFNYTDRFIEEYSVDGSGGGHIHLSSPTSGGSGVVCCAMMSKSKKTKIAVKVRWQVDGCTYLVKSVTGRTGEMRNFHYEEATVFLDNVAGPKPVYLETHFYPNGSVSVKTTSQVSSPEIKLDEDRRDQSKFSRCEDERK